MAEEKTVQKRKPDGNPADQQSADQYVPADHDFHDRTGVIQHRGQHVRSTCQRECADGGIVGFPGTEPDDFRGDRYRRRYQCPVPSRSLGEKNFDRANRTAKNGIFFCW